MHSREKVLKQYGRDTNHVLFAGSSFAVFNDKIRDVVIRGRCQSSRIVAMYLGNLKLTADERECNQLQSQLDELTITRASCSFTLSPLVMQQLKGAIKKLNATHLRFHSDGDKLRVIVFDYVRFHSQYRLQRKASQQIQYYETLVMIHTDFTTTFLAESFARLPIEYLDFRVGENGITQITTQSDEIRYLIRDQRLKEPMTTFFSPRLSKEIALVLDPMTA
jgi:hypothetical protein